MKRGHAGAEEARDPRSGKVGGGWVPWKKCEDKEKVIPIPVQPWSCREPLPHHDQLTVLPWVGGLPSLDLSFFIRKWDGSGE